jgi:Tol biopolymer transport system component
MFGRANSGRAVRSAIAGATLLAAGAVAAGALGASGDGVLDTTLASRASGVAGAVADGDSHIPSTSADGRYVAFHSFADNLDPDSNDSVTDVFVRDLQTNTTTLASRASGVSGAVGDGQSSEPSISADGRYVAFQSDADNLDPDSDDAFDDVFVRDLQSNTTTLASRATGAAGAVGDALSFGPSISADGRRIAFISEGDNLDPAASGVPQQVFVRDLQANTTAVASRASGASGAVADSDSFQPWISTDGRHVAFDSIADNLDPDSDDSIRDVFVRDLQVNSTTLVSRATGAAGAVANQGSQRPSISADGHQVAFITNADNLDPDFNDTFGAVFVRDLQANTTIVASRASGATGVVADAESFTPSISADGRRVAFQSDADNLDPASNDAVGDIFVRELIDPITARCAGKAATKVGTSGPNKLRGTPRRDVIAGLGGNDVIRGLAGKDILCGGKGRDRLLGGKGRDTLLGQAGRDVLRGGPGRDKLRGGPGRDRLRGGPGRDTQIQ